MRWFDRVRLILVSIACAAVLALAQPPSAHAAQVALPETTVERQFSAQRRAAETARASVVRRRAAQTRRSARPAAISADHLWDSANLITSRSERRALRKSIDRVERHFGGEVLVVTLNSACSDELPKRFATRLFNDWHVQHPGVLVMVLKDVRRIEIEVGSKLNGVISTEWTNEMLRRHVLPHLRRDEYGRGLTAAIDHIGARFATKGTKGRRGSDNDFNPSVLIVGGACSCFGVQWEMDRRRRRTCPQCGTYVEKARIGEWKTVLEATDKHAGRKERTLHCQKCGATSLIERSIKRYDDRRRGDDGTWDYYYNDADDGGGSDGGGGGGGDF